MPVTDLRDMTREALVALAVDMGEKPFRGNQLYEWVVKGVSEIDHMRTLPASFRNHLSASGAFVDNYRIVEQYVSEDGTLKVLGELSDGNVVESVFMTYSHGHSVCVSTQVGCRMGCTFCASTRGGRIRQLTAGEYLGQIYALQALTGKRVTHVVLMGSGEPLENYDETVRFIQMATDTSGLNLSGRHITVSTCGLTDAIYRLADEGFQLTLAISLHNAIQAEREEIMPIAKRYPLDALMTAVVHYIEVTGRRVTFEYALIRGVNDSEAHIHALGTYLREKRVHVNLIPVNPTEGTDFGPPTPEAIRRIRDRLEGRYRIAATVRRELGSDINAACGQLRNRRQHTLETRMI